MSAHEVLFSYGYARDYHQSMMGTAARERLARQSIALTARCVAAARPRPTPVLRWAYALAIILLCTLFTTSVVVAAILAGGGVSPIFLVK